MLGIKIDGHEEVEGVETFSFVTIVGPIRLRDFYPTDSPQIVTY